jgi:tape measure domain-containing protein
MAAKADLKTTISADMTGFAATMRRAGGLAATTGTKIGQSLGSASGAIGGLVKSAGAATVKFAALGVATAAAASAAALFKGVKLAADMQSTSVAFETMLGSAESAQKVLGELQKLGAETPFEFPELAGAGRMLLAFGESADTVAETLRRVGDVSSGVMAPIGEIAELYGKARVQGTLFSEDINQLTGRGIPIIQEFAKQLGVSQGEVKKLASEGKITFPMLETAFVSLTSQGGQFFGMMEKQSKTFNGVWSTLTDSINMGLADIGKPIMEALIPGMNILIGKLGTIDFAKMGQDLGAKIPEMVAGIMSFVDGAYKAFQIWQRIGEVISATFLALSSPDYWSGLANIMTASLLRPLAQFQDALKAVFSGNDIMEALSGKGEKSPLTKWLDDLGTRGADKIQPIVDVLADAFRPLDSLGDVMAKYSGAITAATSPEATTGGEDLAAKAAEYKKAGFGGLGGLYQMQADKYNGAGVGGTTFGGLNALAQMQSNRAAGLAIGTGNAFSMSNRYGVDENGVPKTGRFAGIAGVGGPGFTTGLGEKRRLRTSGDDKGDKKNLTLQEKQVSSLESIESKIGQALTVN